MSRKRNELENQYLNKTSQKGASIIILALIIMVFMSVTIIGITKLTIAEKKRAKSTSVSAEAYQKADEAMECALWGRNKIIETCSNNDDNDDDVIDMLFFPQDIRSHYCSQYSEEIKPYHLGTDNSLEVIKTCASPLYISLFTSTGQAKIEASENALTGEMTKQRGIGATVHTSDGPSDSILFKPYVCCNRIASKGTIIPVSGTRCNGGVLDDDEGPDNERGWLDYWEPCANICLQDPCAYYNTGLTNSLNPNELLDEVAKRNGAHWCWTNGAGSGFGAPETPGTLYNCMLSHTNDDNGDDAKYWNHPDVEGFCSVCNRLDVTGIDTYARTGNICRAMADNVDGVNDTVWGNLGKPINSEDQGALGLDDCYSCNCAGFETAYPDFCNTCP
ncbi:MAG: hypothetical protein U9Q72_01220 [Patescibacteria group bacterium]|nr:hypothetical protein [Patescibacteria group bacterium]